MHAIPLANLQGSRLVRLIKPVVATPRVVAIHLRSSLGAQSRARPPSVSLSLPCTARPWDLQPPAVQPGPLGLPWRPAGLGPSRTGLRAAPSDRSPSHPAAVWTSLPGLHLAAPQTARAADSQLDSAGQSTERCHRQAGRRRRMVGEIEIRRGGRFEPLLRHRSGTGASVTATETGES